MRKRVKYVTAHAQKFSDVTICILIQWYVLVFHLSKLFFWQLVQWGSDNRGCTVPTKSSSKANHLRVLAKARYRGAAPRCKAS